MRSTRHSSGQKTRKKEIYNEKDWVLIKKERLKFNEKAECKKEQEN